MTNFRKSIDKYRKTTAVIAAVVLLFVAFLCVPVPAFDDGYSEVVLSSDGRLLSACVAKDGQWRFAPTDCYSDKYIRCLTQYEDKYFFRHPGVNPISIIFATYDNVKAGEVVRGGSTISMQVVRLARKGRERTVKEKLVEMLLAIRLELRYSKRKILNMYAANAPFGGNVVGIDAAAWRYFNTSPDNLTWSEAAILALLPNSPAIIRPGKNETLLLEKRNKLLSDLVTSKPHLPKKIKRNTAFSEMDCELAELEEIPPKPFPMPMSAYHYLVKYGDNEGDKAKYSSLNYDLQLAVNDIVTKHHAQNAPKMIENAAVIVVDHVENKIVAYVGNALCAKDAAMVDMIDVPRSTGSILKPFLYAAMLDEGLLLPEMLLPDIPMNFGGYTPKNYSGKFLGAVKADEALANSLNMPFVYLLRQYGVPKFYNKLKRCNMSLPYSYKHYGLSLILGGAEISLHDIVNAYCLMAQTLYGLPDVAAFSPAAVANTFNALLKVNRPLDQVGWQNFSSSKKIAWKTGTSFGFKDAWTVGITQRYVVGVWVGNSNNEGRQGLTGAGVAAPIMFEVAAKLNDNYEYVTATEDAVEVEVCCESGFPKSQYCKNTKFITTADCEIMTGVCPYHKKIFLDSTSQYRVYPDCYDMNFSNSNCYFVLPPTMEWFYKLNNPDYKVLPPTLADCKDDDKEEIMSFVYPDIYANLLIPTGIQGTRQAVIFELAHRYPYRTVYWSLNDVYLGATTNIHQMAIDVPAGDYHLRCVDDRGNDIVRVFTVR